MNFREFLELNEQRARAPFGGVYKVLQPNPGAVDDIVSRFGNSLVAQGVVRDVPHLKQVLNDIPNNVENPNYTPLVKSIEDAIVSSRMYEFPDGFQMNQPGMALMHVLNPSGSQAQGGEAGAQPEPVAPEMQQAAAGANAGHADPMPQTPVQTDPTHQATVQRPSAASRFGKWIQNRG